MGRYEIPLFYEEMDGYSASSLERLNEEALQIRDAIAQRYPEIDLSAIKSRLEIFQAYGDCIATIIFPGWRQLELPVLAAGLAGSAR